MRRVLVVLMLACLSALTASAAYAEGRPVFADSVMTFSRVSK